MILGDTCTRGCGFCNVKTGRPPAARSRRAASRRREPASSCGLKHVVITSRQPRRAARRRRRDLGRDDRTRRTRRARRCRSRCSCGDFKGDEKALQKVIDAKPEILAHNMETVRRMHPAVRPQARYERSARVLAQIKAGGLVTKTGIMVGIGEHEDEVLELMRRRPPRARRRHHDDRPVPAAHPQPSADRPLGARRSSSSATAIRASSRGFKVVESGPLVRSSYHADEQAARLAGPRGETARTMGRLIEEGRRNRS